ncbi:MAG: hypothetical protein JXB26_20315 [Candidatus Aminicenantes bacterium]|nr:hypothetical protein [Candidatus Aminicenantes bacterium]
MKAKALGGNKALAGISTRKGSGVYRFELNAPEKQVPLKAAAALPNRWFIQIQGDGWFEKKGCDGKIGWKQNRDRIQEFGNLKQSIVGWWLNPQGPLKMQNYFPDPVLKKKSLRNNRSYFLVETAGIMQPKHSLEFDAQTGLLDRIDGRWEFKNYRSLDGILFPFRLVIDGKRKFFLTVLAHNPDLDKKIFARPSKTIPVLKHLFMR